MIITVPGEPRGISMKKISYTYEENYPKNRQKLLKLQNLPKITKNHRNPPKSPKAPKELSHMIFSSD